MQQQLVWAEVNTNPFKRSTSILIIMLCYLIPPQDDDDDDDDVAGAGAAVEVAEQFRLADLILFFKHTHTYWHTLAKKRVNKRDCKSCCFYFCFWDFRKTGR